MRQFGITANNAHTATAAAAGCFDNHRVANAFRMSTVSIHIVAQRAVGTGNGRHARFLHRGNCRHFVAHQADGVSFRADKDKARTFYLFGEIRVF